MYYHFTKFYSAWHRFMSRTWQIIVNPFASLTLWMACRQADAQYIFTGIRHYVLPTGTRHKLLVANFNTEIHTQGLNQTKQSGRHYRRLDRPTDLMQQAFYWSRSNRCKKVFQRPMAPTTQRLRRSMFYNWWNSSHNTK